ncbi:restriction endonuclease subunit S [Acinetobacter junii]|uniref:restriction endonuclease subunit S n=3 Tax=Acinetobacter TaxID=469 RepID=UPI0024B6EEAC|nr:restriction endonuclease subunit S [Acinetobacter junii]MDI9719850.1 restriction endonuclease subunit S [Acinetobacter junii]
MQFKQYPSYKPSGVEWLGDVPEHWDSCNLKFISKIYAGGTPDRNRLDYWVKGEIPWINSGAVNQVIIKEPSEYITELGLKNSSAKYIPVNSLVMALAGQGKTKGMVAYTSIETTCNQSMAAIVPKNYHYKFLYYWLDSNYQNIRNLTGGDNRDGLNLAVLSNIPCPKISIVEQTQIVSFLDTETTRIDNLIAKQEKLIELLEEQRKSIISHAVTKGLNPNAPMKDSGVEWLGEVPEHFDSIKIKQLAISKLTYGANESAEQEIKEHPRYIRITDIKNDGTLNPESFKSLPPEIAEQYLLANNDILFARSGATVGKTFKYSDSWGVCCFAGYLIKLSVNVKIANPDYVFYYLNSYPYWEYIASNQSQSTIQNVSAEKYANFTIAIPKIFEQEKIVSFLDSETSRIDSLIAKQEKLIEKLKEYRSTIISHAVTGKIDVRDFDA